jgi:hypothetical protein
MGVSEIGRDGREREGRGEEEKEMSGPVPCCTSLAVCAIAAILESIAA